MGSTHRLLQAFQDITNMVPLFVLSHPRKVLPQCLHHRAIHSDRSEEHTSELQSRQYLVCRLLLEKKKQKNKQTKQKKKKTYQNTSIDSTPSFVDIFM